MSGPPPPSQPSPTPPLPPALEPATRRALAVGLYNRCWELLEIPDRTPEQDAELIHAAHASRYHWGEIADTPARLWFVAGDAAAGAAWKTRAAELATALADADDREVIERDLATLPG